MKKLIWILAVLALLLLFPGLGSAIAATVTPVITWIAGQPLILGFGLGAAAMPHLRKAAHPVKHA